MKAAIQLALAASFAAGAAAQPHNHQHLHQHARKHQHPNDGALKGRAVDIVYSYETANVYVDVSTGETIDNDAALEGLADGEYSIVGETTPTVSSQASSSTSVISTHSSSSPSSSPSSSSAASTSSADSGAFLELKLGVGSSTTTSSSSSTQAAATSTATSTSGGTTGVDADFPDGELDCSTFPSDYGAVYLDQTGLDGWAGLEDVGVDNYVLGQTSDIADFSEPTSGGASAGMFAGYACPAGYDMAQWPAAQGLTGQSIGGLWCGSDNKLYLTRSSKSKKLCQKGVGNVYVTNNLDESVCICKTAYPGLESMVLPTCIDAGETKELFNPDQNESFVWEDSTTSAQYYINLKGLSQAQACVWNSPSPYQKKAGNWAGINIGTSQDSTGTTYLSVFHNTPTSDASLDYNIKLSGDISDDCEYSASDNTITGDDSGGNGCTVATSSGEIYINLNSA